MHEKYFQAMNVLNRYFSQRRVFAIKVIGSNVQNPATSDSLYSLRKGGECYFLYPIDPKLGLSVRMASGLFIYCILADNPNEVICAQSIPRGKDRDYRASGFKQVEGHTSISFRQDVMFAGQIEFSRGGFLKSWDNASGHYKPSKYFLSSLTPYIQYLLPKSKFIDCF